MIRHSPSCPRCGYDLSGSVAVWNHDRAEEGANCPLEGTCTECGLDLKWSALFRPEKHFPAWFVESPRPPRKRFAVVRTALAALLPWRFWRTVSLEVPIEQRRVKWWLIACILLPIATMIVLGFGVYALDAATVGGRISPRAPLGGRVAPPGFLLTALREFAEYEARVLDPRYMRAWLASFFALAIIMPIVLVCLPATRAIASIRLAQVLRAATYAFAFAVPIVFYGFATTMLRMYAYFTSNWDLKMRARQLDPYCAASQSMDAPQWLWILVIAWFILWWACALKIGFRMKEWRLTLIAMLVPALIAGLLLMHMNFDFSVTNVW